jgi:hypothetical protein
MSLSPWVEPFFEGSDTAVGLVPGKWPVALAGRPLMFEPKDYVRSAVPIQRDPRDDSTEPGEQTLSPAGLWRRSQSSWDLGAGQEWLDEEGSERRRFHGSLGVDVLTTERQACLLPETQEKRSSANSNLMLLTVGSRLYAADGATLLFSDGAAGEQAASWSFTSATGLPGGNILDVTSSGAHIYVVGSDNSIYRATPGTTSFAGPYYNPTAVVTKLWFAIGRLFASTGASLYEITGVPGETLIFTHPSADAVISSLVGGPTGIYFGVNIGSNSEVRHTWVSDDGTTFVAPISVASFQNETLNDIDQASAAVVVGTSLGFRFAVAEAATTGLVFGPAVTTPGAVGCLTHDTIGAETFFWFGWTNIVSGTSGLGRIRPSRFTEPLVPAYASDIYSTAGGTPLTVASIGGRRYFGISADGFFGPTPTLTLVASGTISTGRVRYGLLDAKVFANMYWQTDPLDGTVQADVTFDTGATREVGLVASAGTVASGEFSLGPTPAEWMEVTFTLSRDTVATTTGPCLRWWVTRAIPAPRTTERILLPVVLTTDVTLPGSKGKSKQDVAEILDFIKDLVTSQEIVSYQEGHTSENVYVVNFEQRPKQWNHRAAVLESITLIEMLTT